MKIPEQNTIALVTLILGTALTVFLFAESRNDPSLRIAALVAGTNTVASLISIASTILTGKDVTKKEDPNPTQPAEPANSMTQETK